MQCMATMDLRLPAAAALLLLTACGDRAPATARPATAGASQTAQPAAAPSVPPPACTAGARPTPASSEGPYFKAGAPERTSLLEPGLSGARLTLAGHVLTRSCAPVARARLDVWQADGTGRYDNDGYRLRGYQLTDDLGSFRFETVVPAPYSSRIAHIHVKVQAPGRTSLTTQLFFPEDAGGRGDRLFQPDLVMRVQQAGEVRLANFDFVLDLP